MIETQVCRSCNRSQPKSVLYYQKTRSKAGFASVCKLCRRRRRNAHKDKRRRKVLTYLCNEGCIDCNESNPLLLEFDHVIGIKQFTISNQLLSKPWDVIEEEIQKCVVRCKNCHAIKTIIELEHYNNLPEKEYWVREYIERVQLSKLRNS